MGTTEQLAPGVEVVDLAAQTVLVIRGAVSVADLPDEVGRRSSALADHLRRHGTRLAGPPFVRYHTFGQLETDFELGVPVAGPAVGDGEISLGELSGGPAAATWHVGPHDRLGDAYRRLADWLKVESRVAKGPAREVYHWLDLGQWGGPSRLPDPADWHTRLVQPVE